MGFPALLKPRLPTADTSGTAPRADRGRGERDGNRPDRACHPGAQRRRPSERPRRDPAERGAGRARVAAVSRTLDLEDRLRRWPARRGRAGAPVPGPLPDPSRAIPRPDASGPPAVAILTRFLGPPSRPRRRLSRGEAELARILGASSRHGAREDHPGGGGDPNRSGASRPSPFAGSCCRSLLCWSPSLAPRATGSAGWTGWRRGRNSGNGSGPSIAGRASSGTGRKPARSDAHPRLSQATGPCPPGHPRPYMKDRFESLTSENVDGSMQNCAERALYALQSLNTSGIVALPAQPRDGGMGG